MYASEFLIKPASSRCNIDCEYCFYKDISKRRKVKDYGHMSIETLEQIVKKAYLETEKKVVFAFQGGEPLLVGIKFYNYYFELIEKYNKNKIMTEVSIQTNATLITKEFAQLFYEHHVLVGVSLDGPNHIHNLYRYDYQKNPTYELVMQGIKWLRDYHVEFNILTVVTLSVAQNIKTIYQFFKEHGFYNLQFIEALDGNFHQSGNEHFSLTNEAYYQFLEDLFICWYDDLMKGNYLSIRTFDVMIHKILGNESVVPCFSKGICQNQTIVEANGDVFTCDFYVTEKHLLGNLLTDSLQSIYQNKKITSFIKESMMIPKACQACAYYSLCRNGCKRYRVNGHYYYCEAVSKFYQKYHHKLLEIAELVKQSY